MRRLVDLTDRYGSAITADLAAQGWDIVDLVESGRVKFVLSIIDHLPRTSAYVEAVAQDDELAEHAPDRVGRPQMSLSDYSPEVEALAVVVDRLAEVANTIVASVGGKPARVQPYPRPVTAFDRVRARRRREAAADLERKLFPDLH